MGNVQFLYRTFVDYETNEVFVNYFEVHDLMKVLGVTTREHEEHEEEEALFDVDEGHDVHNGHEELEVEVEEVNESHEIHEVEQMMPFGTTSLLDVIFLFPVR